MRLIVVALLIPASFELAGFRLTPALIVLIFLFPPLAVQFLRGTVTWRLPDAFFLLFVSWQSLTILLNNPNRFVAFTGQQALLTLTGYLAGRLLVRDREDFVSLIRFVAAAAMVSMPFAFYEAVWDDPLILRLIADHTPFTTFNFNDYEPRLGLYRAQFVFTHPIHYGLMSALVLAPFFIGLKARLSAAGRFAGAGVIGLACFLSVSSGAVLSVALQLSIALAHRVASLFGSPWKVMFVAGGLLYAVLEVLSTKSAFVAISTRLAFNSSTAYYRTLIWEYGSAQVWRTPIFGNGENYWPRPFWMQSSSVDNHWLLMAMVHGIPAVLLLASSILYAFFVVNRGSGSGDAELDRLRLAWTLALIGFCMSASTVAIWGEIQLLFMLIFGAGFWMADAQGQTEAPQAQPADVARHVRYTRFAPEQAAPRPEPDKPAGPETPARTRTPRWSRSTP